MRKRTAVLGMALLLVVVTLSGCFVELDGGGRGGRGGWHGGHHGGYGHYGR